MTLFVFAFLDHICRLISFLVWQPANAVMLAGALNVPKMMSLHCPSLLTRQLGTVGDIGWSHLKTRVDLLGDPEIFGLFSQLEMNHVNIFLSHGNFKLLKC